MMRLRAAILFFCAVLLTAGLFLLPVHLKAKDAGEVELRFDGRPKVGETYMIAVNSRQVRTYRMKLVGISNPPRRRETHEVHAVGELVYQSLDPLVIQFKVEMLSQIVDGVKTDYAPLAGMTAIVRSSGVNLISPSAVKKTRLRPCWAAVPAKLPARSPKRKSARCCPARAV